MRIPAVFRSLAVAISVLLLGCSHSSNGFYAITVALDPPAAALAASASLQFSATVQGSGQGVTWSVQEADGGSVTAKGLYTAPTALGTYHLVATSVENKDKAAIATIQVLASPQIESFTASPTLVAAGGAVVLTGVFSDGLGSVGPGQLALASGQKLTVQPTQDTTYILTVTSPSGQVATASVAVRVAQPPVIDSFLRSAVFLLQGDSATLTPTFHAGTGVISPGVGAVVSGVAYPVSPAQGTTYTLTVTSELGTEVSAEQTVNVVQPIEIGSFTASNSLCAPGGSVLLQPLFTGGTAVINPGVGAVQSGQTYPVSPTTDTTYSLVITSPAGPVATATTTVTMAVAPTIQSLLSSSTSLMAGDSLTLTPTFSDGTAVLSPGLGPVVSGVPVTDTPAETTTYTLTVTGDLGVQVTRSVQVNVLQPLRISAFAGTPASSFPGDTVVLQPVFAGGTGVITPGVGVVTSGQLCSVAPQFTTNYTLTVTDGQGQQVAATTQVLVRAHGGFTAIGPMGTPRKYHAATLLSDGSVLVTGGIPVDDVSLSVTVLNEAERYQPGTGLFSPVGAMVQARTGHAAVLLANGKVLVTGGNAAWGSSLDTVPLPARNTAELWDPASGQFTLLPATMTSARRFHTATLLSNGQVLICGGLTGNGLNYAGIQASAELFDPVAGTFTALAPMTMARQSHRAVALLDGSVLLLGGVAYNQAASPVAPYGIANAELFTFGSPSRFEATGSAMATGRGQAAIALMADGRVFLAGGLGPAGTWLQSSELYEPTSRQFALATNLTVPAPNPVAALLGNGQVVVIGQGDTEVFDPVTGIVASVTGLGQPLENGLTATPLANGLVLVLNLEGAKLFDPLKP